MCKSVRLQHSRLVKNCTTHENFIAKCIKHTHTKGTNDDDDGFFVLYFDNDDGGGGRWGAAPNAASRNASCDDVHDGNVNGVVLAHGNADLLPINIEINS